MPTLDVVGFRPVTYSGDGDVGRFTSPPYDVVDDELRDRLTALDAHNVVRLILPADEVAGDRYERAARTMRAWLAEGVLVRDDRPTLYVYEVSDAHGVTRGVLAALGLRQPDEGVVLPHEDTMAGPVADRLALTRATAATLEPIMLVYEGTPVLRAVLQAVLDTGGPSIVATVGPVRHSLWSVTDPAVVASVSRSFSTRRAVIADGHHRYATALAYQRERRAAAGPGPWDRTLAWLVDAGWSAPRVAAIHRVLPTLTYDEAVGALLPAGVEGQPGGADRPTCEALPDQASAIRWLSGNEATAYVVTDGDRWAGVDGFTHEAVRRAVRAALPADRSGAWRGLDVSVAHRYLFEHVWGVPDTEETVWYRHDVADAVAAARGSGGVAVLLRPTPVEAVVAVAAQGERMPRKSTLFLPKPRSGLVLRLM